MVNGQRNIQALACGIFTLEIQALIKSKKLSLSCKFLDSMLHMMPALLEYELEQNITKHKNGPVLLVFGDCQPRMFEMSKTDNVCRVTGMNCYEILLGQKKYHDLRSEGVFFLLPEWTKRWEEVFQKQLGFNKDTAKTFMGDMHTKLLYLDTGVSPVPHESLQAAANFCGLPVEILKVNLNQLLNAILNSVSVIEKRMR